MSERVIRIISETAVGKAENMRLIREKAGVYVYRCLFDGRPAVAKYYECEGDRREIGHYRRLREMGVPTIPLYAAGERCIIMEDISVSDTWRLGEDQDMDDPIVLRALAKWYFQLHEAGEKADGLDEMYSENAICPEDVRLMMKKLPRTEELGRYVLERLGDFSRLIRARENTLTYNDFCYTNLIVRRDRTQAMMFDYNLMGRGYRYADFRNIDSSVSTEAFGAFEEEYGRLYREKHGRAFMHPEEEARLDKFLSDFAGLMGALKRERFPGWAEEMKEAAESGLLLRYAKGLMGDMRLIDEVRSYIPRCDQEARDREEMLARMERGENLLTRENTAAHWTASAWVVSPDRRHVLMAYHNIYKSWAWLGGHADGEEDLLSVALREAKEESGITSIRPLSGEMISLEILPVAGHMKRGEYVSSHVHLNATYLFEADMDEPLTAKPDENSAVGWIRADELKDKVSEEWMKEWVYGKLMERAGEV